MKKDDLLLERLTEEDLNIRYRNIMRWKGKGGPAYLLSHLVDARLMATLTKEALTDETVPNF